MMSKVGVIEQQITKKMGLAMNKKTVKGEALPEGWREVKLEEVLFVRKEKFNPVANNENIICIDLEHIEKFTGRIISYSLSSNKQSMKSIFYSEDILYGKLRPNLRKYAFPKFNGICTSEILVFKTNISICVRNFAFYLIQSDDFYKTACRTTGTKMPRADWSLLKKHPVIIPSFPEQKAIASLLGRWDTAIEKTEALIAAKEQQFDILVKNLIAVNQYAEVWQSTTIGSIFDISTYPSKSSAISDGGDYYIVDMGAVSRNGKLIAYKKTSLLKDPLNINDLVMPKDDIGGGNIIGKVAIIEKSNIYSCGDHVYRLVQKTSHNSHFLKHLINCPTINRILRSKANGTAQLGLGKRDVANQPIWLPPLKVQEKIAKTLNTAKQEINLLKQLAEQYRIQKRGLMQKLLTGKWRVKL